MELLFIDETGDQKFKQYFGLCVAAINAAHYKAIKNGFHSILRKSKWNEQIEFKGSHLFSALKGDTSVPIEQRIRIAGEVLDLNKSDSNARLRFHYYRRQDCTNHKSEYLTRLPQLIRKALPKAQQGRGKDLVIINCDFRQDVTAAEIQEAALPTVETKGYTLFEEVRTCSSNFHTVGILYADLVSYLVARIDTISSDIGLFEGIAPEQLQNNGKVKKLNSSTDLMKRVKKLETYALK